jgi:hypothetical protein
MCSHECEHGTHECAMSLSFLLREHLKGLMFDCHRQQVALMVTPISKASVGTSADAARMSAYATMISTF